MRLEICLDDTNYSKAPDAPMPILAPPYILYFYVSILENTDKLPREGTFSMILL